MIVAGYATEDWHAIEIRRWVEDRGFTLEVIERPDPGDKRNAFPDKSFGRVLRRLGKGTVDAAVVATVRTFGDDLVAQAWGPHIVSRYGKGRLFIVDPDEDRIWSIPAGDDPDPDRRRARETIGRVGELERRRAACAGTAALSMPGRRRKDYSASNVPYGFRINPADPTDLIRDDAVIAVIAVGLTLRDEHKLRLTDIGEYFIQRGFRPRDTKTKVRLTWSEEQVRRLLARWRGELTPAPLDDTARLFLG